ncbi:ATP-binding cassette domain-containing protein [Chitinimonas arctica]|uniref:ATP-binding cassette domain-containing protein n=1 Tax=Chitinimonas arctica TaxID=2594795 RepID=A0A516SDC8_9NEIS|nr:ABC transporter transmembrane domain-containing protein [Chitinimonas arctica]QDQ26151.1 ATP-binding cassette domain-containing protein [Chitinimonas arctica]
MTLSRLIGQFVRQHWQPYALSALMLACVGALTVFIPRQVGSVVDGLVAGQLSGEPLLLRLGVLLLAGLGIYFLRVGWRLQLFAASYRLGVHLRTQLYRRLSLQGPSFYQQQRTGDLMALATNDVDAVEMASGEAMLAGFDGTLTLVMVVAMMTLGIDWRLALVALTPFPLMALSFWYISNQIHRASHDSLECFSQLNDHVQETLSGVRTIRALGLEARSAARFAELAENAATASLRAQRWEAAYEPAVGLTLVSASVLTLALGGYLVWQQQLSIGALTAFSMYLGQLIWPMFAAGWVMSLIERGRAAWNRMQPVLDAPLTIADQGRQADIRPGLLSFDKVGFHYPGQQADALQSVSFTLPAGQTLGLVGPTGAGKSSIIRLILRQYAQQSGDTRWNDTALSDYQLEALHGAISWVPQEPFLFSASIADNIALGKPNASQEEIERAARLASIHDDILRFAQGYRTPVGEKGVTLSGGQRQRVAIARALLMDAPLLLLDDALSAVDTQTETDILSHLREARRGRTVIIVSHRLSAVMDADQILVLKHGRIVETGRHAALLEHDGWYAAQWRYQQLEASLDAL